MLSRPRRTVLRAFTLLELIVVLVVLALLAALAIPTFSKVTRRADNEGVRTEVLASMRNMVAYAGISELDSVDIASVDAVVSETNGRNGRDVPFTRVSGASTKYGELSASVKDGVLSTAMVTRVGDCVVARVSALGVPSGEIKELDGAACLPDGSKDGEVVSEVEVEIPPLGPPATIVTWTCDDARAYLKWDALAGATGYEVYRKAGTGQFVRTLARATNDYEDTEVANAVTYSYYLVAFNATDSWRASEIYTCTPGSPTPQVPNAPEGAFSPTTDGNVNARILDVSWRPVLRADAYQLYRDGVMVAVTGASNWDARLGAVVNRDYALSVSASNDGGTSAQSATTTVRADQYVAPAPELSADGTTTTTTTLSWRAPEARTVRIYKDGVLVGSYDARFTSSSTIRDLSPETAYTFSARSVNSAGESEPGSVVVVTPSVSEGPVGPGPGPVGPGPTGPKPGPVAVTSDGYRLKASASYDRVVLNWQGVPNATSYDVYSGSVLLGNTTDLTWTHLGLSEATTYSYFLVAKTGVAPLAPSDVVRVTTTTRPVDVLVTVPLTPSGVSVLAGDAQALASWGPVAGAGSYRVYLDGVLRSVSTSATLSMQGLTNGRLYSLRVSAVSAAGESSQSASVTFTPTATTTGPTPTTSLPDVPGAFTATGAGTEVLTTWSAAARAATYLLYRDGILSRTLTATSANQDLPGTSSAWSVAAANTAGTSAQSPRISVTTDPAAPFLSGTTTSGTAVLSWTQRGTATTWTLLQGGTPVGTYSTRTATITGLANGTKTDFTVVANSGTGVSAPSNTFSAEPVTTPGVPTNLSASADAPEVALAWALAPSPAAAPVRSQQVYRNGVLVATTALVTNWRDTKAPADAVLTYRVASVGPGGTSAQSAPASVRTPPATPSALAAVVPKDGGSLGVTWNAVSGANYVLERDGVEVYRGPVTAYTDAGATAGASTTYRVRSTGAGGSSAWSAPVRATAVPLAPSLSARSADRKVVLTWTRPEGAQTYRVYRQEAGETKFTLANVTTSAAWDDATVDNAVKYTYYVTASNVAGEGVGSSTLSVTPNIAPPSVPASVGATTTSAGVPTVTWGASTGTAITSYNVWKGDVLVGVVGSAIRTWTGPALALGETAVFSVSASNGGGEGARRAAAAVVRAGAPATPVGVSAEGYHLQADALWTKMVATTAGPISGYYVYVDGQKVVTVNDKDATLATVTGLNNNQRYAISVSAFGPAGESARSPEAYVTPRDGWAVSLPFTGAVNTGLFDYLGKMAGGGTWTSPAAAGVLGGTRPGTATDRNTATDTSNQGTSVVDLGPSMRMKVTKVVLNSYSDTSVRASTDGVNWVSLATGYQSTSHDVTNTTSWRYFEFSRYVQESELYGSLRALSSSSAPVVAPVAIKAEPLDGVTAFYWEKLAISGGIPVTGYNVYVDDALVSTVTGSQRTSATVPTANGKTHRISIAAVNPLGTGPKSSPLYVAPVAPLASLPFTGTASTGLFDYLGKAAGGGTWTDPAAAGIVGGTRASVVMDRSTNASTDTGTATVDLGPGMSMQVTKVALTSFNQTNSFASNDGTTWVPLANRYQSGALDVASTTRWRYFQFTGYTQEAELYGTLYATPAATKPTTAPAPVRADPLDSAVAFSWTKLGASGGLPVTSYNLYVDDVLTTVVPGSQVLNASVPAPNGKTYQVSVAAVNTLGVGPRSASTSVSTVAPTAKLPYTGTADRGVFDYLGKAAGNGVWTNPVTAGRVGGVARLVDRVTTSFTTSGTLDLGAGSRMQVTTADFRMYGNYTGILEGSNDGVTWVRLAERYGTGTASVTSTQSWRQFRLSGGQVGDIELYGDFYQER